MGARPNAASATLARPGSPLRPEPLSRMSDLEEYRAAFEAFRTGAWDEERWTGFRLRFGVYGQRQPGVQMIRIKIPGGIMPIEWARVIADVNRRFANGHIHLTTRQDCQIYHVPLADTPALLEALYLNGLTTREACGNTLRNMTACMFSGGCPREHVDAGQVASRLARMWIRHPLVQHMPRKFKVSVSGCATDCAASGIHDLGLIAVEKDGRKGFEVYIGGGLGGVPVAATKVLDFAEEHELSAVIEAAARMHHLYSNRKNRNAARIKFVLRRFGPEKFRAVFLDHYARAKEMPQRPWEPLAWRTPDEAPAPASPGGVFRQHDGRYTVVASPVLGNLSSEQMEALADIAERRGAHAFRVTIDQNLAVVGLPQTEVPEAVREVRGLGIAVEDAPGDVPDVVTCPGTTTCRLGITNSPHFGEQIVAQAREHPVGRRLRVRVSGCQNSCGQHHVGDFGFHGMAKKIDGRHAPHYQIHLGGDPRQNGAIGLPGPVVPARYAKEALARLMDAYAAQRVNGESVRDWALRLERKGIADLLAPLMSREAHLESVFQDWGEDHTFDAPRPTRGECAAGFAQDSLLADLADDGLINLDRAHATGNRQAALAAGRDAFVFASRRLMVRLGDIFPDETLAEADDQVAAQLAATVGEGYRDKPEVTGLMDRLAATRRDAEAGAPLDGYREAVASWLETAAELAEVPAAPAPFRAAALDDFDTSVLDAVRGRETQR